MNYLCADVIEINNKKRSKRKTILLNFTAHDKKKKMLFILQILQKK